MRGGPLGRPCHFGLNAKRAAVLMRIAACLVLRLIPGAAVAAERCPEGVRSRGVSASRPAVNTGLILLV